MNEVKGKSMLALSRDLGKVKERTRAIEDGAVKKTELDRSVTQKKLELMQGRNVYVATLALIYDITIPVEAETLQGAQDAVRAAGNQTWCIEVFDSDQPAAAVMACIEKTSYGREE